MSNVNMIKDETESTSVRYVSLAPNSEDMILHFSKVKR